MMLWQLKYPFTRARIPTKRVARLRLSPTPNASINAAVMHDLTVGNSSQDDLTCGSRTKLNHPMNEPAGTGMKEEEKIGCCKANEPSHQIWERSFCGIRDM